MPDFDDFPDLSALNSPPPARGVPAAYGDASAPPPVAPGPNAPPLAVPPAPVAAAPAGFPWKAVGVTALVVGVGAWFLAKHAAENEEDDDDQDPYEDDDEGGRPLMSTVGDTT